jgi:hypothetical protein
MRPPARLEQLRQRVLDVLSSLARPEFEEELGALTADLLWVLDEEARAQLVGGGDLLFGSLQSCRPVFVSALQSLATRLNLSAAELTDNVLVDELFQALLSEMRKRGDLVFASDRQRARSRFFETVHYIRNLRQRTAKGEREGIRPRLVEMLKVEVRKRERPVRDFGLSSFMEGTGDLPYDADNPLFDELPISSVYDELQEDFEEFLQRAFRRPEFSKFQAGAFKQLLDAAFSSSPPGAFVIAAGTGFGKTEAFLLPLLYYSTYTRRLKRHNVSERRARDIAGVDSLLLYPRIDLCDNQAERLVRYLFYMNGVLRERDGDDFKPLRVAIAHSRLDDSFRISCPACAEERDRDPTRWDPAHDIQAFIRVESGPYGAEGFFCERKQSEHASAAEILVAQVKYGSPDADIVVTTIDTLHRRLMDEHGQKKLFKPSLLPPRFIVIDELHIYEGQSGAHAANILRRCKRRIEASRTDSDNGASPIFVGASATIGDPTELASRMFGLKREAVADTIQPSESERKTQGLEYFLFVQAPGNRLVNLQPAGSSAADAADDDDGPPGVDRFVSERATMIQAAMCLHHSMKAPAGKNSKRRTLGFVDSVDSSRRLGIQLDDAEWQGAQLGTPARASLTKTPLYALRLPPARNQNLTAAVKTAAREFSGNLVPDLPVTLPALDGGCRRRGGSCAQPPHHLLERCDRYEAGECWFTMAQPDEEGLRPIAVQTHQSGLRAWGDPYRKNDRRHKDLWRVLISTSALEVGFDHPEIIATWQYHAPPSLAGFVQRKGRGGRGVRDYPITMMVLGTSAADRHAFQNHLKYVDDRNFTAYVDEKNPSVRLQHIFSAALDWCASNPAYAKAYACNLGALADALKLPALATYVRSCFEGLTPAQVSKAIGRISDYVTETWLTPLNLSGVKSGPSQPVAPLDLFREYAGSEVAGWKKVLEDEQGNERTQAWLAAACRHYDAPDHKPPFSIIDFDALVPNELKIDPDLTVPSNTIPVPIGRYVTILEAQPGNVTELAREPGEFALRSFLPGGFKIRYNRNLWMAPWNPVPGKPPENNRTWAAARRQLQTISGATSTVAELLQASSMDLESRDAVLARVSPDCNAPLVRGLHVEALGTGTQRTYLLDLRTRTVVLRKADGADSSRYIVLSRDPNVESCTVAIPMRNEGWDDVADGGGLIRNVRYLPTFKVTLCHYANLVHCYPKDGNVQTIVVRFWDEADGRPLAPSLELRSQAVSFSLELAPSRVRWTPAQAMYAFWRRVEEDILERLVIQTGALDNAYVVPGVVELLRMLEANGHPRRFLDSPPTAIEVQEAAHSFVEHREHGANATTIEALAAPIASILTAASTWTLANGFQVTLGDTAGAALARAASELIHVSPSTFRRYVSIEDDTISVVLYDDLDGGSGNARRLSELIKSGGLAPLEAALRNAVNCPARDIDVAISTALSSGKSPDLLFLLAADEQIPAEWVAHCKDPAKLRLRLRRLFESPEIAAFNSYANAELVALSQRLLTVPPHLFFVSHVEKTPAFDERAEVLRLRFRRVHDGIREIGPRLREVQPLCIAGCPECLDDERFGERPYVDRTLLASVLSEESGADP